MGEAKRRHDAIGKPLGDGIETKTGETLTVRYGGRFREYVSKIVFNQTATVPCNGCNNCCYHRFVDVYPEKERPEDLAHLDLVECAEAGGGYALRKRDDGGCIHLTSEGRCGVYEHRPQACRFYDCRPYSLVGLVDTYDGDRHSPGWAFDIVNPDERAYEMALRIAAAKHMLAEPEWNSNTVLAAAFNGVMDELPKAIKIIEALDRLPPEERAKIAKTIETRLKEMKA